MPLSQKYLNWNSALIPQIRDALLEQVDLNTQPIDLSHLLIIVPTNQSGRHLLAALADNPVTESRGFLSPQILTPLQFLERGIKESNRAHDSQCQLAWIEVFEESDSEALKVLFPKRGPINDTLKASNARRLHRLRMEIGIQGYDLQGIATRCRGLKIEGNVWDFLADLEKTYYDTLKKRRLLDPMRLSKIVASNYPLSSDISKILIVATPNPEALPLEALKNLEADANIEVWINGPNENSGDGLFDSWGIPVTEEWSSRTLNIDEWNCDFKKANKALDIPEILKKNMLGHPVESLQIGLLDSALVEPTSHYLKLESIPFNNPEGYCLNQTGIGKLVLDLIQINDRPNIDSLKQLLMNPYFFNYTKTESSLTTLLDQIDQIFSESLCYELSALEDKALSKNDARALVEILKLLKSLSKPTEDSSNSSFSIHLSQQLNAVISDAELTKQDTVYIDLAESLNELISDSVDSENTFPGKNPEFYKQLFLTQLSSKKVYKERQTNGHDLFGWLELLWHDAPKSILCGMNEGIIPSAATNDPFLPETLKQILGLKDRTRQLANDTYLFESLCRRRTQKSSSKVTVIIPENDCGGNPLMPSRILFQTKESELLRFTDSILIKRDPIKPPPPYQLPWVLSSPIPAVLPQCFSVTALKDYLTCPFRFYLKHILKIRHQNFNDREMSPKVFGDLFHQTVLTLNGQQLDKSSDTVTLIKLLQDKAETLIHSKFGKQLSFALEIQKESLLTRIQAFVKSQIGLLKETAQTEIISAEKSFKITIKKFSINGVIDRIDTAKGQISLIDYKTANTPKFPAKAHLKSTNTKGEPKHLPEAAYFEHANKSYYWSDLQLPLYCHSEVNDETQELPDLFYYNIPKSAEQTALVCWDDFTKAHLESAYNCAEAILELISQGCFWPPNETLDPKIDEYSEFFPDGIKKSIDGTVFENYKFLN